MTAAALALPAKLPTRLFLDVERSVCGRAWRDRLDERASARAVARANAVHFGSRCPSTPGLRPSAQGDRDPFVVSLSNRGGLSDRHWA